MLRPGTYPVRAMSPWNAVDVPVRVPPHGRRWWRRCRRDPAGSPFARGGPVA
ncbi:MAG: hypothetical protein AB7O84_13040 [Planctomycetota bacterium]